MSDVMALRLVTGEVLIGYVVDRTNVYEIDKPLIIGMNLNPNNGRMEINMVDYMPFAKDNKFNISRDKVLHTFRVANKLENSYRQKMSGIITSSGTEFLTESK